MLNYPTENIFCDCPLIFYHSSKTFAYMNHTIVPNEDLFSFNSHSDMSIIYMNEMFSSAT